MIKIGDIYFNEDTGLVIATSGSVAVLQTFGNDKTIVRVTNEHVEALRAYLDSVAVDVMEWKRTNDALHLQAPEPVREVITPEAASALLLKSSRKKASL